MKSPDQFTSYSQLGEDRVLAHLFKHRSEPGFYIDAGAFHPFKYSNTALLHEAGWSGINIDLAPQSVNLFKQARPNDIAIHAAIGELDGELECYFFGDGPSTIHTADPTTAELWKKKFKKDYIIKKVPAYTLETIIELHGNGRKINFLNIDIEGFEMSCLRGLNLQQRKPDVIAIEIHAISFEKLIHSEAYLHLQSQGYKCVAYTIITAIFCRA